MAILVVCSAERVVRVMMPKHALPNMVTSLSSKASFILNKGAFTFLAWHVVAVDRGSKA